MMLKKHRSFPIYCHFIVRIQMSSWLYSQAGFNNHKWNCHKRGFYSVLAGADRGCSKMANIK